MYVPSKGGENRHASGKEGERGRAGQTKGRQNKGGHEAMMDIRHLQRMWQERPAFIFFRAHSLGKEV